jgi:hypothetical protein
MNETIENLIDSIYVNEANFEHMARTGKINGTLRGELRRIMREYSDFMVLEVKEDVEFSNRIVDLTCDRLLNHNPAGRFAGKKMDECADLIHKGKQLEPKLQIALTALLEISEGKGRYDMDRLKHASNTIEDMKDLADKAIKRIGGIS